MFINQLRQKIGVTFGNPETTTGGNALKFYASMRLDVRRIGQVKVGDELVGGRTRVKVAKNKCAPPFTRSGVRDSLRHRRRSHAELIDLGLARGLIEKSGNHLSFAGTALGNGRERSRECARQSPSSRARCARRSSPSGPVRPGRRTSEADA